MSRTKKDEQQYDEQCRRENSVLGDLVRDLKGEVAQLRVNEAVLFENLLRAEDALRVYRARHFEQSKRRAELGDKVPGFYWDTVDGWHRESERQVGA